MEFIRIPAGVYAANCYIIYSEIAREGIVVDPGGDAEIILGKIDENKLSIKYIVLTHGHGDHMGGVIELNKSLNVPVLVHEADKELMEDGNKNMSVIMSFGSLEFSPDVLLKDGDVIEFGDLNAEVIHTPGHTKGCICLKIQDHLFTGDTLFKGSIGRTDLFSGDYDTIISSIREKILPLDDNIIVLPGHGAPSTIGEEKKYNPYLG
ncbi:MBL fold metallo-hydrolase [Tissierellaceae bacterium HCP3S3_D8]